ncbi:type II secretion system secretin GspD [Chiayiivirga flava]|uniref:General secretion pathway protein D n=1 Tax=Chiayiivirga flava TaxID=659595 RepID=A0A7W8FZ36_9GAMM|nr:type II secretion system secretin GspD [Chiayiivirga flava]MBB5208042.1 general secretion pathway protein D [Chiayiivirga flava]
MLRSTRLSAAVALLVALPLFAQTPPVVNVPKLPQAAPQPATPADGTGTGTAAATTTGDGRHTLNLKAADMGVLIQTVSEITGKSFIVDPRVEGRVTVISARPQTAAEIYETFLSVLRVHGFAAVASGDMVKIVPDALAAQDGSVGNGGGGADALVTRLVPIQHISADDVVKLLRPLAPQQATFAAHPGSNSVLITDRAGNVERLMALIRRIDTQSDSAVEVIALRHASAAEVARTLTTLEGAGAQGAGTKLIADERTNSILLSGDRSQRLRLRSLVAHLDTPLDGGENTQVIYLQYAKADDLVPILDGVTASLTRTQPAAAAEGGGDAKSATIQAHAETNSLIVTASPAVFREIQSVVRQLDVRRAQVLVEAIIAEVTDELADEIGVQWQSSSYDGGDDTGIIGGTNFPRNGIGGIIAAMADPAGTLRQSSGLNLGYVGGTIDLGGNQVLQIGALVKALRGDGRANIMSNPSVVTLDNHEAEFKVVQEVPFLTGSYTNTSSGGGNTPNNPFQTVERKDVGLILTVTPHINSGDSVRLEVKQEVSSIANSVDGAVDLITNKRELTTSVMVADGGLLILGGLSEDNTRENIQGVPYLSRIPLIGNLFKSRDSSKTRRNLMVFLRPIILRDAATEAAVSGEKYNFLRTEQLRMRENRELKYNGNVLPPLPPASIPSQPRAIEGRNDLMSNPPPIPPQQGGFETGAERD